MNLEAGLGELQVLGLNLNSDDLSGGVRVRLEIIEEIDVEQLLLAGEASQQGRAGE